MTHNDDNAQGNSPAQETPQTNDRDYGEYLQYTEHSHPVRDASSKSSAGGGNRGPRERAGGGAAGSVKQRQTPSTALAKAMHKIVSPTETTVWGRLPRNGKLAVIAAVVLLGAAFLFFAISSNGGSSKAASNTIPISQVVADARAGKIFKIVSQSGSDKLEIWYGSGKSEQELYSTKEDNGTVQEMLIQGGVSIDHMPVISVEDPQGAAFGNGLVGVVLALGVGLVLYFYIRDRGGSAGLGSGRSFRKASARKFDNGRQDITFAQVAGVEEAKGELAEVVEFLRNPGRFKALGARIPKGVLMVGPPGTGKTHLSRAVAGEAGVPFFSISGSEFVEMFVGVGASRIRDLFAQAKRQAPAIIFIDELDAVGRQRSAGAVPGSNEEREQTLMQLLVEMDGFDVNTGIVVIGATNRPDILDQALLRPGRFDRQVVLDKPDLKGRVGILGVHAHGKPFAKGITLETIAKMTPGFSGADLENLLNEAAILAARRHHTEIYMHELEEAVDRVVAGPARRSRVISDYEKAITAYHEVGHALTARMLSEVDPVHKISIVARGMAGGYTRVLPGEDRYLQSRSQFRDFLVFALGGRAAEEIIFDEVTTGASNDIERVTDIARGMVMKYGMSSRLGLISLGRRSGGAFLGSTSDEQVNYSDDVAREIDKEVKELVDEAYARAKQILTTYHEKLVEASELLIEKETLDAGEFEALFTGIPRPEPRRKRLPLRASLGLNPTPKAAPIPTVAASVTQPPSDDE